MKELYLSIMEKALVAYTDAGIRNYYAKVKEEGITEHGFARLVANIGILLSKGKCRDLHGLFLEMMDFTTAAIPTLTGRTGNDFAVREVISAIMELENTDLVSEARITHWRDNLSKMVQTKNYKEIAPKDGSFVGNWAAYNAASEFLRVKAGIAEDNGFVDNQIASQLANFDENGMYMDPHEPMLYDLAARVQLASLLFYGYEGKHAHAIYELLDKSAELTLKMQSTTGSIPFGGRSNQMLFNEAYLAALLEFYVTMYAKLGDEEKAARFKLGAVGALKNIWENINAHPATHVKNYYPKDKNYGCEAYAYFDKYMITLASFCYLAYVFANDDIAPKAAEKTAYAAETGGSFHKVFLRAGDYFAEFDLNADAHYDATGLGRLHKKGAPEAIVLSVPFAEDPNYRIGKKNSSPLALSSCLGTDVRYFLTDSGSTDTAAFANMNVEKGGKFISTEKYAIDENGIEITVEADGLVEYNLPTFLFDGEMYTNTTLVGTTLRVYYRGFVAEYSTKDAKIFDTGTTYRNRNGVYRLYKVRAKNCVRLSIKIYEGSVRDI